MSTTVQQPSSGVIRHHGEYWILPLLAFLSWTSTMFGLLIWWLTTDKHKKYEVFEPSIVYVSDVGAVHQTLFIAGTSLTLLFFSLTLIFERWLRHLRRLPGAIDDRSTTLSIVSVVFGICGGIALVLLSVYNTIAHPKIHSIMTLIFVVCNTVSTTCQTFEVRVLAADHPGRAHLRRNAIIKLVLVALGLFGGISFAVTLELCNGTKVALSHQCDVKGSIAAVFEWSIAFFFDLYLFTFILDLWPARQTTGHHFNASLIEADRNNTLHPHKHPHAVEIVNEVEIEQKEVESADSSEKE